MGLPDEKLVDACNVPVGLRCAICTEVFVDPVCGVECQHVFCSSCMGRATAAQSRCPLCRVAIDQTQLRRSHPIQSLVDDLKVMCDYKISGCGWTGRLQDCAAHQAACPVPENANLIAQLKRANARSDELARETERLAKKLRLANAHSDELVKESERLAKKLRLANARVNQLAAEKLELAEEVSIKTKLLGSVSRSGGQHVQVFVRDPSDKVHVLSVNIDEDISAAQLCISSHTGWDLKSFYLTGFGQILHPGRTGREYGIRRDATLCMNARLLHAAF
ncbi:PDZRN4 [Symbiodinium microadriaticum]|nr:PDZRN4 [Symbiodinium microadriaticum]